MSDADLKEIRELFTYDTQEWQAIRDEGAKDMLCVAGNVWEAMDPKGRKQRDDAVRPVLSLDELSQYVNQSINELRANKRAVKFAPTGNGATDQTAAFYADKMREIEYRSRAQVAYITAAENAIQRSYGFVRVSTRYAHPRSANQDLWIEAVSNPDAITPDPDAVMPDLSDMTRCWVRQGYDKAEFRAKWPKAKVHTFSAELVRLAGSAWLTERRVFVAELWKVRTRKRMLLVVQPAAPPAMDPRQPPDPPPEPIGIFEDELPKGQPLPGTLLTSRRVDDRSVVQQITNGLEILEETAWPGAYIPIVACLGKVIYLDEGAGTVRKILSMIRLARDPAQLYNYLRTCEAELVGMTPKFPYFWYEGTLSPEAQVDLAKSLHEPVAGIKVKPIVDGSNGQVLGFPQRQPYDPPIAALEAGAESARRAIQAAMGISPLPTSALRRNDKSGIALKQIESSQQMGSFHFKDHFADMLHHVGVIVEDLMDKIYDTARDVGIRKANDTAEIVRINDPTRESSISTTGDHLVTVSTGPSFDSERDAASDFADTLMQIGPLVPLIGDLVVKLKNLGPIGDEIAERLTPPQFRQQQDGPPDPRQLTSQLAEAHQQLQQLQQAASGMKQALETEQAKQQATIAKAKIDASQSLQIQRMKDATAIAVAKIAASTKGGIVALEAENERIALAAEQQHEALQNEFDRTHDVALAAQDHANTLAQADQAHDHALTAADQGVQGQIAVQAAAPQPPNGSGA